MAERDEEIDISDDEQFTEVDRRELLTPIVTRVVEALGGLEDSKYRMGDEVAGCLRDLKKLWRKDDTDDDRTVARLLWESRVLVNDLIPILLCTAGKGLVDDKRAISAADLITAMTWPIDIAEELKELDDEHDLHVDYTQLIQSHRVYKAALLKPEVLQALLNIMLAPLAKPPKDRQERDGQIINVVLHLIRNLAFIKDLPLNSHASADQVEYSTLQSKLIKGLSDSRIFQLLLTVASNTYNDKLFNNWNTLILEIFYLLFRGVRPDALAADQAKQSTAKLHSLLAAEQRTRAEVARKATSRHSRFGTTISVSLNTNKKQGESTTTEPTNPRDSIHGSKRAVLLHRQSAVAKDAGGIMDLTKKTGVKKIRTTDELSREENLSVEAKTLLQNLAIEMLDACFNPFLAGLLKDIRSERAKITEKDHLRLLYITKWFLEFFLAMKARNKEDSARWNFGLIAEVTERAWIVWVLKCMREAVDSKPKAWTSLQAGIECLTQLLLLIDAMSSSQVTEPTLREAAEILQHQLVYNGEILDIAFESVRTYKEGTQSLVYLDASVHLAHALLRMLEKLGKGDGVYVRRKGRKRVKKRGNAGDEDDEMNEEDAAVPDEEEIITEALFSFEAFQMRFAHADITKTLLAYLSRYKDFSSSSSSSSSERIRRVVSLMHRQAVKSKAEGLFFNVSTLSLFKSILDDHKQNFFPKEQPYKDLISFVNYILRQFFKNMQEKPFLAIEALFPMNRGHWKQFSSWEPEKKEGKQRGAENRIDERFPQDVQVKKGYSWSQQVGIAIAVLVGDEKRSLVELAKTFLEDCISKRQETINMVDQMKNGEQPEEQPDGDEHDIIFNRNKPSAEALSQIEDYQLYFTADQDEAAQEATRNPHFKPLLRLCHMFARNEDDEEFEWYIPAGILLSDLEACRNVITQFLDDPIDLDGKTARQCLSKKARRRRRRSPTPSSNAGSDAESDEETKKKRRKKKEKKEKEQAKYKSAQFIEDSEDEFAEGDAGWEVFLAKEAEARERILKRVMTTEEGEGAGIGMRPTGTKKRRRKGEPGARKRRRRSQDQNDAGGESSSDGEVPETNAEEQNSTDEDRVPTSKPRPRPKPRPKIRRVVASPSPPGSPAASVGASASVGPPDPAPTSD